MKSIKHRLLSLLLTLVTVLSLLPTVAFAASNTGSGLKITTNQAYWSTRLLANGTPYSYRPPLVDGKLVYCMDSGLGYMQRAFSSELKPRARLVLQVLVLHCNKEGECFPSIKTIAAKCGYGVSTVKRALDELVKAGYIVKQARFDERKNGGQTSNLYTLCSDLLCPDEPENAPVLEDDASDESPAVQPESAPADACNASDPTPGEQSATLPTADSYSFADGFETKIGRQFCRPIRMWTGGQSIFIPP